ncbi:hypothetical protein H4O18_14980 [Arenibacter sp. BSSL-BM3]|uniref:Uncharacterized protein n=1 Tax=Arenibacter arenosicollis TaxID=2762274 RepID=A0ABR7QQ35_9FLAO|nr:hypothetical protein [Arenibacter arenosicollis]MBC8769299.1 hypothetical protein [Arenibacter arenosicollis]
MGQHHILKILFIIAIIWLNPSLGFSQYVANVPEAFKSLNSEPELILINNKIKVPSESGHFQGVQLIEKRGTEKLLVSGSSLTKAYVLQINLKKRKTDKLITLMTDPYRHAGGIQVSEPYMIVGIEDNILKTTSKVCLYYYSNNALNKRQPNIIIEREGQPKQKTAGATGLLALASNYLAVVANWDSRNWDFYQIDTEKGEHKFLYSFTAPNDWGSYQSINLIKDDSAIYAIGFHKKDFAGKADLILVSKLESFEPIMEKVDSKSFNCKNGVDFNAAVGLQVDSEGKLIIWSTQADPGRSITVNRFIQK